MKRNTWKKTIAFVMAFTLVAGTMPANVGGFLTGGTAIVAKAAASSGTIGTASYTIDDSGVLTIGAGEFTIENWASVFGTGGTSTSANSTAKSIKSVTFESGATLTSDTSQSMFYGWTALRSVDLTNLTASNVTHIGFMFMNCQKLTSVAFGSGLDTSKVNNMRQMFRGCSYLTALDLSTFKSYTGNGTRNLYQMFYNCSNLKTIRVSDDWNVENASGNETFSGCNELKGGNGTQAYGFGDYSYAVIDKDGQPGYFTSASAPIEHRHDFSYSASGSTLTATCSASDCGLTDYKIELTLTPPAKTVYGDSNSATATLEGREAFNEATGLNISSSPYYVYYKKGNDNQLGSAPTTPGEYTVKVTISNVAGSSYTLTADYTIAQKEIGLTWADTTPHYDGKPHVPTATATGLVGSDECDVTVTGEQTAIGTYTATASGLSNDRYKLPENNTTEFAIEGWVGTARYTIEEAPSPKKLFAAKGISHEITNGVLTIYGGEFNNADWKTAFANDDFITNTRDKITSVRFVKANDEDTAAKLTDSAQGMFQNWAGLKTIDFTNLDTSSVTWMGTMFCECSSLTELDLSPLDTKKVTNMNNMFYKCSKLEKITVGANWKTASSTSYMFSGCNELAGNAGTTYKALFGNYINTDDNPENPALPDVNGTYARVDGGKPAPGFFYNAHEHHLTYTVDQSKPWTITATCSDSDCYLGDSNNHSVSISLVKPTLYVYYMDVLNKQGDEYDKGASPLATLTMQNVGDQTLQDSTTVADPDGKINGISISVSTFTDANTAAPTFQELTGATIGEIEYYEKGSDTKLDKAPSDAGTYTAKVTIGDVTASVDYRIAKRFHSPVLTSPTKNPDFAFGETEQDLIISGTIKQVDDTDTSTFEYALGTDATTIPAADKWSKEIPKGSGNGPFYVFYRVAGDKNHGSAMESEFPNKSGYANTSNPEHESNSYKPAFSVIVISSTAPTPPTPNELNYTGGDQALVTEGSTTVGKMQYALGEIKSEQPSAEQGDTKPIVIAGNTSYVWKTGEWSDTVPEKKEPGVYYVLYRVVSDDTTQAQIGDIGHVMVTIGKGEPTAVAPTATATYGQTLNDVSLDNPTGNTLGTWAWAVSTDTSVGNAGTNSFEATFTPTDTTHYKTVTVNVPVTVNKATPAYTTPTGLTATYGQTLANVELPEGWTWTNSTTSVGNIGQNTFTATFTPEDTVNYSTVTGVNVTVNVGKANPVITLADYFTYNGEPKQIIQNVIYPGGTELYLKVVDVNNNSNSIPWTKYTGENDLTNTFARTNAGNYQVFYCNDGNTSEHDTNAVMVDNVMILKANPTANQFTFTPPDANTLTYDNTAKTATVALKDGVNGMGSFTVKYYSNEGRTNEVAECKNAGTYYVGIEVDDNGTNYESSGNPLYGDNWQFTIAKAEPTANAPTGLTATYGKTLADVSLENANPSGNTPGTWTWVDDTTNVGSVGDHTFKAKFTPTDGANYNSKNNVDVTITVNKASNPATVTNTATVMRGGNTVNLSSNVALNGATGIVSYQISGDAKGCTVDGNGVLTSGTGTGTVTVNVTVATDANYEALAATPITVTIGEKNTQTITADNVTATYGDTNKSVSASTNGGGTITYAVKTGSEEYISVDATTGALTINKVPANGKAYVTVTAAETQTYDTATTEVTVTINKASALKTAPTAKNPTRYSSAVQLINAGTVEDGCKIEYSLGTNTAPGETWETDATKITANKSGTFYVWYKVTGTDNYEGVEPENPITVKVSQGSTYSSQTWTLTMDSYEYDGTAHEPIINGRTYTYSSTQVQYTYYNADTNEELDGAPSAIGNYKVKVYADGGSNYYSRTQYATYSITDPIDANGMAKVDAFKENDTVPVSDGKIFAGWFTDETCTTAYTEDTGKAYAKFIDENILTVKAQISSGTTVNSEKTSIRFITSVDSLKYQNVGFKITFNGKTIDKQMTKVYTALNANGKKISPKVFSEDSNYMEAYTLNNIPQSAFGKEFTVTPYYTTQDGTIVEGKTNTFTIANMIK